MFIYFDVIDCLVFICSQIQEPWLHKIIWTLIFTEIVTVMFGNLCLAYLTSPLFTLLSMFSVPQIIISTSLMRLNDYLFMLKTPVIITDYNGNYNNSFIYHHFQWILLWCQQKQFPGYVNCLSLLSCLYL